MSSFCRDALQTSELLLHPRAPSFNSTVSVPASRNPLQPVTSSSEIASVEAAVVSAGEGSLTEVNAGTETCDRSSDVAMEADSSTARSEEDATEDRGEESVNEKEAEVEEEAEVSSVGSSDDTKVDPEKVVEAHAEEEGPCDAETRGEDFIGLRDTDAELGGLAVSENGVRHVLDLTANMGEDGSSGELAMESRTPLKRKLDVEEVEGNAVKKLQVRPQKCQAGGFVQECLCVCPCLPGSVGRAYTHMHTRTQEKPNISATYDTSR